MASARSSSYLCDIWEAFERWLWYCYLTTSAGSEHDRQRKMVSSWTSASPHTRRIKSRRGVEDGSSILACVLARIRKRATDFMSHAVMLRGKGKPVCFAELWCMKRSRIHTLLHTRARGEDQPQLQAMRDNISYLKSPISVHCIKRSFIYMKTTYERDDEASAALEERRNWFLFSGGCLDDSNTMVM